MTIVIKAARIFDGRSDALLRNSSVVVDGNKIAGLGNSARVPSGGEVIDLGDATLAPGFIDAHTHLSADITDYTKWFVDRYRLQIPEHAYRAAVGRGSFTRR